MTGWSPSRTTGRPTPRSSAISPAQGFTDAMQYNNAKAGLIYDIYERIFAADPDHPHSPHPR